MRFMSFVLMCRFLSALCFTVFACEFFEYGVFVTNAFRTSGLWHVCELPTMGSVLFVFTPFMALLFTLVVFM